MSCEKAGSDTWVALHNGASLKLAREQPIPPASPIRDLMFKVARETATKATQTVMVAGSSQDTEDLKELDCISWSSCGTCAGVAKERQYERKYRKPHTKASEVDLKQFEFQNEQPILPSTVFFFAGPHVSRGTVRSARRVNKSGFYCFVREWKEKEVDRAHDSCIGCGWCRASKKHALLQRKVRTQPEARDK
ncbi:VID27 cytoplasmic protein [Colletotrichum lupini]|uniref:VID27 cytoplasmic protein n=1 Tax=Colletotrichum lupini TaxID=145971 RepID=A0A9Q8WBT8_9PEZI|nr:VID27 cytoplasmic protein [Colletotrichum lupini]UQC76865.1 VID27 cytoplasmic protein [Colletotrichum lupini]